MPQSGKGQTVSNNDSAKNDSDKKYYIYIKGIRVTDQIDYLIQCIEMNFLRKNIKLCSLIFIMIG